MKFYLVDYENVHVAGFDGLKNIDDDSKLCIFYSKNADSLTFGLHRRLSATKAHVEYFLVDTSVKNGLDFQLVFYAGYLANEFPDSEIYVVSNDKGYDCLTKLANKLNSKIIRIPNLVNCKSVDSNEILDTNSKMDSNDSLSSKVAESNCSADLQIRVEECLADIDMSAEDKKDLVVFIVDKLKSLKTKTAINNNIQKYLKNNERHRMVFNAIKPLLKDKT